MPLWDLPFNERFGWVHGQVDVSWQLNLPKTH